MSRNRNRQEKGEEIASYVCFCFGGLFLFLTTFPFFIPEIFTLFNMVLKTGLLSYSFIVVGICMKLQLKKNLNTIVIRFALIYLFFLFVFPPLVEGVFLKKAVQTDAIVDKIAYHSGYRAFEYYMVDIEYYANGEKHKAYLSYAKEPDFREGEIVKVYYDSKKPTRVMEKLKKHYNPVGNYLVVIATTAIIMLIIRSKRKGGK